MSMKETRIARRLYRLITIFRRLRGERGCPWDRVQTHLSLIPYLQEETREAIKAIRSSRPDRVKEEMADLLLQILFHCQIASESGSFDIGDVMEELEKKLVRRHPHVFGKARAGTVRQSIASWEKAKRLEKKRR